MPLLRMAVNNIGTNIQKCLSANKFFRYSSTWLPVTQFCTFGPPHPPTSSKMASPSDSTTETPSESGGPSLKRPIEPELNEAPMKRIQLNPTPVEVEYVRRKRRKYALLLSYSGKGYLGMQRNHGFRTIEGDLLIAFGKANLMSEEGQQCPQLYQFQRAARTDKGVSAARQVVSVKLPEDIPDMTTEINKHLCSQIRVMDIRRTTKGFNCKSWCDSRTYSYMCPTFTFSPIEETTKEDYRITPQVLDQIRDTLKIYKGTHNFHNFTARKKFEEASAKRYIIEIECGDPFVRESIEWVIIRIKGQSFMLHQIRKMVGLAIAVLRGLASPDVLNMKAWGEERVDVPIAPSLGLVLEEPHYDLYNLRYGSDGIHETLNWDAVRKKIQDFREEYIDSTIINTEIEEKSMLKWLATLPLHTYDVREVETNGIDDGKNKTKRISTAFGKAARYLKENSEDEEVDDIDGDLDEYRIKPDGKEDTTSDAGNEISKDNSVDGVNGIDDKGKMSLEKDKSSAKD